MCNKGFLNIKESDRILVVAPHPDDESIGCGGLLQKYAQQADVLLLSKGEMGYNHSAPDTKIENLSQVRRQEFEAVMNRCGVKRYTILDFPDGEIYKNYSVVSKYDIREYDYIFVTSRFEQSQDHKHAFYFMRKMIKRQHAKATLVEYEIWVPLPDPTHILDIGDVIDGKISAVSLYHSQLAVYDYANFAFGLSLYRGARFKRKNVEAFFVQPKQYHMKILVRALTTFSMRQRFKALLPFLKEG